MKVLIIADALPMPDRNAADFRFFALLGMIAERHDAHFCAINRTRQAAAIGDGPLQRYVHLLRSGNVGILEDSISQALKRHQYGAVVFEWHFPARALIDTVRVAQPRARIIIDSVDVVFNRLEAKAHVTGAATDSASAKATKTSELAVYAAADVVITVSDADAAILHHCNPAIATITIPTVHPLQEPVSIPDAHACQLLFIGSFSRPGGETNIDGILYFCREILPVVVAAEPRVRLRIIGSNPPPEVLALASERIQVLGFVPETKPFLENSVVSIAPLRFGGGMKGKIGEAMSFALPVVTTSTGIEGFGLSPGVDALVGDTPQDFAAAVIRLLHDRAYLEQVRMAGYRFIRSRYSDDAIRARIHALLDGLKDYPIKPASLSSVWRLTARGIWDRHLAWRFK